MAEPEQTPSPEDNTEENPSFIHGAGVAIISILEEFSQPLTLIEGYIDLRQINPKKAAGLESSLPEARQAIDEIINRYHQAVTESNLKPSFTNDGQRVLSIHRRSIKNIKK